MDRYDHRVATVTNLLDGRGRQSCRETEGEKEKRRKTKVADGGRRKDIFTPLLALEPQNELSCFDILKVIFLMPAEINVY